MPHNDDDTSVYQDDGYPALTSKACVFVRYAVLNLLFGLMASVAVPAGLIHAMQSTTRDAQLSLLLSIVLAGCAAAACASSRRNADEARRLSGARLPELP